MSTTTDAHKRCVFALLYQNWRADPDKTHAVLVRALQQLGEDITMHMQTRECTVCTVTTLDKTGCWTCPECKRWRCEQCAEIFQHKCIHCSLD